MRGTPWGPEKGLESDWVGWAHVGEEGTVGVIAERHKVARYGFHTVWEEGVRESAGKTSGSQAIASQNLAASKGAF